MAAVAERSHADILSDARLAPDPVSVTMRFRRNEDLHWLEAVIVSARRTSGRARIFATQIV